MRTEGESMEIRFVLKKEIECYETIFIGKKEWAEEQKYKLLFCLDFGGKLLLFEFLWSSITDGSEKYLEGLQLNLCAEPYSPSDGSWLLIEGDFF